MDACFPATTHLLCTQTLPDKKFLRVDVYKSPTVGCQTTSLERARSCGMHSPRPPSNPVQPSIVVTPHHVALRHHLLKSCACAQLYSALYTVPIHPQTPFLTPSKAHAQPLLVALEVLSHRLRARARKQPLPGPLCITVVRYLETRAAPDAHRSSSNSRVTAPDVLTA